MYDLYMQTVDELDRRLVSLLRTDGRCPVARLARLLNVSRATVNSRIDRLVASGVIVGFTVRVREGAQTGGVQAVTLIEVEGRDTDRVIRELRGFPEIVSLHTTNGGWDLVAQLEVATLAEFDALLGRIRRTHGVVNSETSVLLTSVLR